MLAKNFSISNWLDRHSISVQAMVYLLLSQLLSTYAFWVLLCLIVVFLNIQHKGRVKCFSMPGSHAYWIILCMGLFVGMVGYAGSRIDTWPFLRDLIHYSAIFLYWQVGASCGKKHSFDLKTLYNTTFLFCGLFSLGNLILALPTILANIKIGNYYGLLTTLSIKQEVLAIGAYLTLFPPLHLGKTYISRTIDRVLGIIIFIALVASFSRTALLILVILILCNAVHRFRHLLKALVVAIVVILIAYTAFPYMTEYFVDKVSRSFIEISAPDSWTSYNITQNWRGYETYCAQRAYKEANLTERLIGKGFGATIDANGYAHLVTSEDALPYLHNGYYTVLIKFGLLGVLLNAAYYFSFVFDMKRKRLTKSENGLIFGLIISFAVTEYVIHGMFFGQNVAFSLLILSWSWLNSNRCEAIVSVGEGKTL